MSRDVEALSRDVEALSRDVEALSRDVEALSRDVEALSRDVEALSRDVEALSRDVEALSRDVEALSRDVEALSRDVEALSRDVEALSRDVEALSRDVEALSRDVEALSRDVEALSLTAQSLIFEVSNINLHICQSNRVFLPLILMLKRYMHRREREHAMRDNNRIVRPFEWGMNFVAEDANGANPREFFREYSKKTIAHSDEFFCSPEISDYELNENLVTWTSGIETGSPENNTVYAHYFPVKNNKKSAVLILPHWNAKAGTYFDLGKMFNRVGISALRLTLPYHEKRNPPDLERADYLVAPNVGQTLQSLRQAVVDTRSAVRWLKEQGYEKVGLVGTSIGSCVGFFAFVHDLQIDAGCFNHVSGYVADVVWNGLSTHHVKEGIGKNVSLDELREYWLPISPMAYMDKLAKLPARPQRYIYTLYDLTFPINLSRQMLKAIRESGVKHDAISIPCGHYTLGEKPWVYIDGYKIISFLRKNLR